MATSTIPNVNGTWELIGTQTLTEGTLSWYKNSTRKEGLIIWQGNSSALTTATRVYSHSGVFNPVASLVVPIYAGTLQAIGYIGVDATNITLHTVGGTTTWSSATLYFPLK